MDFKKMEVSLNNRDDTMSIGMKIVTNEVINTAGLCE